MQRISWERTTPEGWQEALKRMILVDGVTLTPARGARHRQVSQHCRMAWRLRKPNL